MFRAVNRGWYTPIPRFSLISKRFVFPILNLSIFKIFILLLLCGCSSSHIKEYQPVYWPYPPDPPRYVYEGTLRTTEDLAAFTAKVKFKTAMIGANPRGKVAFEKPYDVASRGGRIVVSDTIARATSIWDISKKRVYNFGRGGEGVGWVT